jgi:hypothetical protein
VRPATASQHVPGGEVRIPALEDAERRRIYLGLVVGEQLHQLERIDQRR